MKNKYIILLLLILYGTLAIPTPAFADRQLAFPGAEGYGRYATGGRGGKTYVVTTLEDCAENNLKEGTLRWAVKQPGPKIVTFAVNGTIYLTSRLCFDSGDLTILGQTAPGEGICLADYPVTISCENAIIRYIRIRLGNRKVSEHEGDGFGLEECNNIIIDHCSFSWSIDECLSISDGTNITIQWCMIEQALCNAGHQKGAHGYGGNWGGRNVSYHHNLIAHCASRVPRLGGDGDPATLDFVDIRNNVFYNWGGEGCYGAEATDANIVNNYYKPGVNTDARSLGRRKRILAIGVRTKNYVNTFPGFKEVVGQWGHFYIDGNINADYTDVTQDNWTNGVYNQTTIGADNDYTWTPQTKDTIRLRKPREFMAVTTHSAEETYEKVLAYAGASLHRDCVDRMIINDVENRTATSNGSNGGTNGMIDTQSDNHFSTDEVENGAWPILKDLPSSKADSDGDGVPDLYEDVWGLDSGNPNDGATLYSGTNTSYIGYSYTEMSVNTLNKEIRAWNGHCTEGGTVEGTEEPTILIKRRADNEHEISALTFKGYDPDSKRQYYADGLSLNATGGISGGTGSRQTLKLRAQQYRIDIPSDIQATALRICGYSNYTGTDIHIAECNGISYGETDYVIAATANTWSDIVIPFDKPVCDQTLTITFKGNSPTVKFYLLENKESDIQNIRKDPETKENTYDLLGRPIERPTRGLFIRNGKKIIIR